MSIPDPIMRRMQELYKPILDLEVSTERMVYPTTAGGPDYDAWMREVLVRRERLADLWGELVNGIPTGAPVWVWAMARKARQHAEHQRTTWALLVEGAGR